MWTSQLGAHLISGNVTKAHTGLYAAGFPGFSRDQNLCICCDKDLNKFEIVIRQEVWSTTGEVLRVVRDLSRASCNGKHNSYEGPFLEYLPPTPSSVGVWEQNSVLYDTNQGNPKLKVAHLGIGCRVDNDCNPNPDPDNCYCLQISLKKLIMEDQLDLKNLFLTFRLTF